jgi:hypothetical protein
MSRRSAQGTASGTPAADRALEEGDERNRCRSAGNKARTCDDQQIRYGRAAASQEYARWVILDRRQVRLEVLRPTVTRHTPHTLQQMDAT